jgi:hypothetical protein
MLAISSATFYFLTYVKDKKEFWSLLKKYLGWGIKISIEVLLIYFILLLFHLNMKFIITVITVFFALYVISEELKKEK